MFFTKNNRIFRRIQISMMIAVIISTVLVSYKSFASNCDDIRHSVLRLHILANSDSKEDQELKLKVRDRILELDDKIFDEKTDLEGAKNKIKDNIELIKSTAENEIKKQGYNYPVSVAVENIYFNTREYENFTMPAGYYDSLRVIIGNGEGKNWWCVLYPPLCLPAAEKPDLDMIMTPEQEQMITEQTEYKYSFAVVELIENIKDKLKKDNDK